MVITLENSVKEFIANRSAEKSSAEDSVLIAVGKRKTHNISNAPCNGLIQFLLCNIDNVKFYGHYILMEKKCLRKWVINALCKSYRIRMHLHANAAIK